MKGLLILVYTVISWYLTTATTIVPLYLLSNIKPLRKVCLNLCKYIMGLTMNNASYFYRKVLNLPIYFYGDPINDQESILFFMNHRSSIDYLFFISLISELGDSSKIKIVMKSILRYFPGLGTTCYINNFPFLKRDYSTDENYLKNLGTQLNDSNLLIFPEGTRYSQEKLEKSNEYSRKNCYPEYRNLLLPKTKGSYLIFKSMMENKTVDSVYDLTINFEGIDKGKKHDALSLIFKNDIKSIHIHARRIPVSQIPLDETMFRQWMHQLYLGKDILLETPVERWKYVYPHMIINKKKNKIIFFLTLFACIGLIYTLWKSKSFRYYHLIILILGIGIVTKNSKYRTLKKPKLEKLIN